MTFISDMFNSSKGAGYQAQGSKLLNPFEQNQAMETRSNLLNSLTQQQQFANAAGVGGGQALNSQQQLLGQLGQQAQGQGPNPALAQLQNSTGQNVAQQASLMGSQRGVGSNPALLARMASQQGAATQQQAAGQQAVMQAQQQLAAQQALQQQQAQMVGQQSGALGTLIQGNAGAAQNDLSALQNYNNANVQNSAEVNKSNSGVASANATSQGNILSKAAGAVGGAFGLADGGMVPGPQSFVGKHVAKMSQGGSVDYKSGGNVPGKASVEGNSLKNDTVPAMLSPGEVVIPRSVMNSKDPAKNASEFVNAILAKQAMKRKSS